MFWIIFFVAIKALCWGSFLNVIAYRIGASKKIFTKRSVCPNCDKVIAWYDNIPVISYIVLKAKCRFCKHKISLLYPLIEILTGVLITLLFYKLFILDHANKNLWGNFISYFIFFSALIINIRTDLENLVISQLFSIYLVPVGIILSYFNLTQVTFTESLLGAFLGYFSLWFIATIFKFFAKKEGLGVGDMELLALIGSFLGYMGVFYSVLIGSITGLIVGLIYLSVTKQDKQTPIPFGPFLSIGAFLYYFLINIIIN